MPKKFDYKNVSDVSDVMQALRDLEINSPKTIAFLEWFCGFIRPLGAIGAEDICYYQGLRDVVLMIKTMQRTDIDPQAIVEKFIDNREGEF